MLTLSVATEHVAGGCVCSVMNITSTAKHTNIISRPDQKRCLALPLHEAPAAMSTRTSRRRACVLPKYPGIYLFQENQIQCTCMLITIIPLFSIVASS